jgi:UDP-N-acetylmuramyl pentapeptide synthase
MIALSDLLQASGGSVYGAASAVEFAAFAYDSRLLRPGELFLAVKTERADGHDYIQDACQKGAAGVLCERPQPTPGVTCIVVADVRAALLDWARYILRRYAPEVIAVTGSVGKTTSKEAIAAVLSARGSVFRNQGNRNDRYGLPIALGLLAPEHKRAVLEIACDHFDEIRELAELIHPRIGVVTAVSAAHLETLGSLENIAQEKGRLVEALPPEGVAVLNADDPRVAAMAGRTRARVIGYGIRSADADLRAEEISLDLSGLSFVATHRPRGSRDPADRQRPARSLLFRPEQLAGEKLKHQPIGQLKPVGAHLAEAPLFARRRDGLAIRDQHAEVMHPPLWPAEIGIVNQLQPLRKPDVGWDIAV